MWEPTELSGASVSSSIVVTGMGGPRREADCIALPRWNCCSFSTSKWPVIIQHFLGSARAASSGVISAGETRVLLPVHSSSVSEVRFDAAHFQVAPERRAVVLPLRRVPGYEAGEKIKVQPSL